MGESISGNKHRKIFGILIALIVLSIIFGAALAHEYRTYILSAKDYIASYGSYAPLIIFILIVIASSIGFIFQIPVAVAGMLLDFRLAFIISILGLTIGATISFSIARWLGRDYMERKFIDKIKGLKDYDGQLHKHGFLTVFFLRLIYVIPYELINIAGGFSRVKFTHFILATLLGIIPGVLVALWFAHTTISAFSWQFVVAIAVNLGLSLIPLLSKRVRKIIIKGG